jgi:hypothetical protein
MRDLHDMKIIASSYEKLPMMPSGYSEDTHWILQKNKNKMTIGFSKPKISPPYAIHFLKSL